MFPPTRMLRPEHHEDVDGPVKGTDSDASLARLSAVQKGYLTDPFARLFVPRAHLQKPRPALINHGTYVRVTSIDKLIVSWIDLCKQDGQQCQIVSLGAGSDTRFWRYASSPVKDNISKYIEVDFPEVTSKKAMSIRKSQDLSGSLGTISIEQGGTALHSDKYFLLPADLRLSPSSAESPNTIASIQPFLDTKLPTLLLFECVLVYMTPLASQGLLKWFIGLFGDGALVSGIVYEMFGLDDSFGKVMRNNLKARKIDLPGVEPSLESLKERFQAIGFSDSKVMTLKDIRSSCISQEELERIGKLEMLDEIEELDLVLAHYALTWVIKLPATDSDRQSWKQWGLMARGADSL